MKRFFLTLLVANYLITNALPQSLEDEDFAINLENLTVRGESKKSDNMIFLKAGQANRAYLSGGFECQHWEMSARFKCISGVSFVMGKDDSTNGSWIEIILENGNSSFTLYNNKRWYHQEVCNGNLSYDLNEGEFYTLHIIYDNRMIGFELFGQYDEYFTHTFDNVTCYGQGSPFFYSDTESVVEEFSLSSQNYYDEENAKCAVWGHSYVEGYYISESFTNQLANAIGPTKVFNFGLGGDTFNGVCSRIRNELIIAHNISYGLVCLGANDNNNKDWMIGKIDEIASLLIRNNITPIFFTIAPILSTINENYRETNAYIRENYLYVDMEQVFLSVDAINGNPTADDILEELYIDDKIHPNIEGHQLIFNRIKTDCPFLFNKYTYKLSYLVDSEEYMVYDVDWGTIITPETAPAKEGYTFSGWSKIPYAMPGHDVTLKGTFSVNKYKLTYMLDGDEYKSFEVEYGASITPEIAPTKEGHTFSGWSEIPEKMPASGVKVEGSFFLLGDANDDGVVNVSDIVKTINFVNFNISEHFNKKAADVTREGDVDNKDLNAIIAIIMSSN